MARRGRRESADANLRRGAARFILNALLLVGSLAVLGFWAWFGLYQLEPGQAAVILQLGRYHDTVDEPGLKWHLPPPIQSHEILNIATLEREEFGTAEEGRKQAKGGEEPDLDSAMQTADNNIVMLGFVVQYRIRDAFEARYRIARPIQTLRDAAQAAVREVVGRTSIDGVLSEKRGEVEQESQQVLQSILDSYEAGIRVVAVQLQEVQPPPEVRSAFDDVIAAMQDRSRAINEAEGYVNEVVPRARGEAVELIETAQGYREAKIADASGEAARFSALAAEYRRAPDVTRKRLYLEAMEDVLPDVEKVIIDSGAARVLPYLPIGRAAERRGDGRSGGASRSEPPPPPAEAEPAEQAPEGAGRAQP